MLLTFDDFSLNQLPPVKDDRRHLLLQRRMDATRSKGKQNASTVVQNALNSTSQGLDQATQTEMGARFGKDFSRVRVHTDASAERGAQMMSAQAYTVGQHIVFGHRRYAPETNHGRELIAHELAHVVQQGSKENSLAGSELSIDTSGEAQADNAAQAAINGRPVAPLGQVGGPAIQRRVEMRDVGRGEQSGFARLPELIDRLNAISTGLTYGVVGHELTYTVRPGGTLSGFDRQMMAFIDQDAIIPLRLTNRHGLLHNPATGGFTDRVEEDAWSSGYVDIDDLLASDDLGMQSVLLHFIRERTATRNYARRIGSPSLDLNLPGPQQLEFNRAHDEGINAEVQLLRDYFGDPSIHFIPGAGAGEIFRVYRNGRGDRIHTRVHARTGAQAGVDAVTLEVVLRNGRRITAEEYRRLLEEERIARQVERERLGGAAEHREGGRGIPAP